ncbi:MAG: ABC-F family ATP-binding cassette domain-containing protein [Cellulosilyticaceae bacterium]
MILLTATELSKIYGEKVIFDQISFSIDSQDKIGLIGVNGTGKSSLLKIIAGQEVPDRGEIATSNELKVEYLPQMPEFKEDITVLEQIFYGESEFMRVLRHYHEAVIALEADPMNEKLQEKLMKLSSQMDVHDAWKADSEAKAVLTRMGITDFGAKVGTLSGGQRKRIALAGALIRPCNLLILDEPTNHLDNDTIDYLEELLQAKKCALLMVTHDRYFLDRVTNKILEIDESKLYKYDGNYETFIELKAQREAMNERLREKQQSLFKQELEWMRKGVEARRTKQKARQDRFYELQDNMANRQDEKMEIGFATSRLGRKIIELKEISKAFGAKKVLDQFNYTVVRGDRIGIVGDNGIGKSTLLNIIDGSILPESGEIEIGETVRIGHYTQEAIAMNPEQRVIDYIKDRAEYIEAADGSKISASRMLERFLFPAHMQYAPIGKLSGGEKRRLYLLGVLMNQVNVLLLDEPTNDLDIQTLQILEDYLDEFDGPVITVSHDRYFLDRIAEKIFDFEGDGRVREYPGNYSDYRMRKESEKAVKEPLNQKEKKSSAKPKENVKVRMSYNDKKEFETIESEIEKLEEKLGEIESDIVKFATNYGKLNELTQEKEEVEEALMYKMERWEYLSELAEQAK